MPTAEIGNKVLVELEIDEIHEAAHGKVYRLVAEKGSLNSILVKPIYIKELLKKEVKNDR